MTPLGHSVVREAFASTGPDLRSYFLRRVSNSDDADDLLGQTFLAAWRRLEDFPEDPEGGRRWLFGIAIRVLSTHQRSWRRRANVVAKLAAQPAAPTPIDDADRVAVRDAVRRLSHAHRELVMLVHWEGFSVAEASELIGISASTARSRYAAARASLRTSLKKERGVPAADRLSSNARPMS